MNKTRILVTCAKGIPPYLREEVRALGYPVLDEKPAGILTEGTLDDCMKLNLWLRTAQRVLFEIRAFQARDADAMYKQLVEIPWEEHIREDGYVSISSSVENPTIRDTRFASLKCKDAIVDRIKQKRGRRPDSGPLTDKTVVFLYWRNADCSVFFDTSGEPLARRGYRKIPLKAPMQETLAAAVVLASGWSSPQHFVNPMCGSGTLAIEAALISLRRAPGLLRDNFGFMHILDYEPERFAQLRTEAAAASASELSAKIVATDISLEAVRAAQQNAAAAGVDKLIEFNVGDFARTRLPDGGGVILMNPEYGERMGEAKKLEPVYEAIGRFLQAHNHQWTGCVFTGNPMLAKRVRPAPARQIPFFNSNIECRLMVFPRKASSL